MRGRNGCSVTRKKGAELLTMNKTPLAYIDGETLLTTVLPSIRFVVSGLLSQGLHVLAGAPKVGKSWLADCPTATEKRLLTARRSSPMRKPHLLSNASSNCAPAAKAPTRSPAF